MPHPSELSDAKLLAECRQTRARRGGPGGQHRNKVETAIVLTHTPSGTQVEANERRSQADNLRQALRRLRLELAIRVRNLTNEQPKTSPSALWQQRSSSGRIVVSEEHRDFAPLVAELFDQLVLTDFDIPAAAEHFEVSRSQINKFLRRNKQVWQFASSALKQRADKPE